ncbi:MBL fold metallo-hydrolase [Pantoea sp. Acro-807]|uniref:MBL fold metallo-hydrolase n=1 Tax=Pantoea sp. Acro-807 TaxID=2608356 RepID=UPI001419968D|nr:MBL fold metallo-hydrolase [Pantoea sp. Acro-807]NIE71692.1 MBL fold metallo-hydrolase [Pantoea sp. Acro-807]
MHGDSFPTCQVGGYQVIALSDGTMAATLDLLSGIDVAKAASIQCAAGIERQGDIHINGYLIRGYGHTILVDAGAGGQNNVGGRLKEKLTMLGILPDDVDRILLTHGHPDHIGGLLHENGEPVYKKADLYIHPLEIAHWQDNEKLQRASERGKHNFALFRKVLAAYAGKIRLLNENEVVQGIRPVWLPGHTPGHTGFHIHSDKKAVLIWGDIVHFPYIQSALPAVSIMFDVDPVQAEETRKKVLQQAVDEKLVIAGMHLDQTGFCCFQWSGDAYLLCRLHQE